MKILSIHNGHNSSASLLIDGEIKYVLQEERMTGLKNQSGFPKLSIKKILGDSNLKPEDIDEVVFSSELIFDSSKEKLMAYYKRNATSNIKYLYRLEEFPILNNASSILKSKIIKNKQNKDVKTLLKYFNFKNSKISFMNHHLSHAASAYFGSHFNKKEKVLVLTADGGGDDLSATVYVGENGNLKKISESKTGHSLGNIYSVTTYFMGFTPLEHEYKLMGMAPYPSQKYAEIIAKKYSNYLTFNKKTLEFKKKIPEKTNLIYQRLKKDMEFERFDNICAGLQMFTENLALEWVNSALKKTGCDKIALAGGLFMNVKLNQRISELKQVKDIFIMPSCGDESLPIGSCYQRYFEKTKNIPKELKNIYFGPEFSDEEILKELKKEKNIRFKIMKNPSKEIGTLIAKNEIVARCSGRMEFGARALGNRSILADASNLDNVRIINMMIKKRDFWMPFAPVMLEEDSKKYIKNPKNLKAPYMIITFDSTDKYKDFIGGVQQADLTARSQIITQEYNKEYYNILKTFKEKTGRSVLMNTSFNLHGLPLVYGPKEALYVFRNSGLRYLQLGDYLVSKIN